MRGCIESQKSMLKLFTYAQADFPADLKRQINAWMRVEWPEAFRGKDPSDDLPPDPNTHHTLLILADLPAVMSYTAVVSKNIDHAGEIYKAYGLSGVLTNPDFRRQGYGRKIVDAAAELIASSDADLSLFTCDPHLRGFYEGSGWKVLENSPLIGGTRAKPFPSDSLNKLTMVRFLSARAQNNRAAFEGTPIYLDLREGDLW